MNVSLLQVIFIIFLLFALSRVFLRFRGSSVSLSGLIFWSIIFGSAIILVFIPSLTTDIAHKAGIGRGVDAVIYISIAILFYLVFRLYVYLQDIRRDISELVKKIALKDVKKPNN